VGQQLPGAQPLVAGLQQAIGQAQVVGDALAAGTAEHRQLLEDERLDERLAQPRRLKGLGDRGLKPFLGQEVRKSTEVLECRSS
jgi:hypothetical protein